MDQLLKREFENEKENTDFNQRDYKFRRNAIFALVFLTNTLIRIGDDIDSSLQLVFVPKNNDQIYGLILIYSAVLIFAIGQVIDFKNIKPLFIGLLIFQVIFKGMTCITTFEESDFFAKYVASFYYSSTLAINFIYLVTFFNWFSRKHLFFVYGLFFLSKGIASLISIIYGMDSDYENYSYENYQIAVIISAITLVCLIPLHIKYFWIEPLDISVICNEQALVIQSYFAMNQHQLTMIKEINKKQKSIRPLSSGRGLWLKSKGLLDRLSVRKTGKSGSFQDEVENYPAKQNDIRQTLAASYLNQPDKDSINMDQEIEITDEQVNFIKNNTGNGKSVYELFIQPRFFKILLATMFIICRNILGELLVSNDDDFNVENSSRLTYILDLIVFRIIMIFFLIMVGYICMTKLYGRKILFFYTLLTITLTIDFTILFIDIFIDSDLLGTLALFIVIKVQYVFGQSLLFFSIYILPVDVGKIALLNEKKKIFGQIMSLELAYIYLGNSFLLSNISYYQSMLNGEDIKEYIFQGIMIASLIPLYFIFYKQFKQEKTELSNLSIAVSSPSLATNEEEA